MMNYLYLQPKFDFIIQYQKIISIRLVYIYVHTYFFGDIFFFNIQFKHLINIAINIDN